MSLPTAMLKEDWQNQLNWEAIKRPLVYFGEDGVSRDSSMMSVVRSDTEQEIGVVSKRYQIVQPSEILAGFEHAADTLGFEMDGVGLFDEGKIIWGRASGGISLNIDGGETETYLYMLTSFDGSVATVGFASTQRMACCNAFNLGSDKQSKLFSLSHRSVYKNDAVEAISSYKDTVEKFEENGKRMLTYTMGIDGQKSFLSNLLYSKPRSELEGKQVTTVNKYFHNIVHGKGQNGIASTAWGLFNGITYTVDHDPIRKSASHTKSAFMGAGNALKQKAYKHIVERLI